LLDQKNQRALAGAMQAQQCAAAFAEYTPSSRGLLCPFDKQSRSLRLHAVLMRP